MILIYDTLHPAYKAEQCYRIKLMMYLLLLTNPSVAQKQLKTYNLFVNLAYTAAVNTH